MVLLLSCYSGDDYWTTSSKTGIMAALTVITLHLILVCNSAQETESRGLDFLKKSIQICCTNVFSLLNKFLITAYMRGFLCEKMYLINTVGEYRPLLLQQYHVYALTFRLFPSIPNPLSIQRQRTVYRLTLVKAWNVEEMQAYSELIALGQPDFIEVKVGFSSMYSIAAHVFS